MKNNYSLEPLLTLRKRAVEEARRALASAAEKTREAAGALDRAEQALATAQKSIRDSARDHGRTAHLRASDLVVHQAHLDRLRAEVVELTAHRDRASNLRQTCVEAEESAQNALQKARRELKIIASHREKWQHERLVAESRAEEDDADEVALARHWHNISKRNNS